MSKQNKKRNYGEEIDDILKLVLRIIKQLGSIRVAIQETTELILTSFKVDLEITNSLEKRIKALEDICNGTTTRGNNKN